MDESKQKLNPEDEYEEPINIVSWRIDEYVKHNHNLSWYAILFIAIVIFALISYLLTRFIGSSIAILVMGVLLVINSFKKPKIQTYTLENIGILIGNNFYGYESFKGFAVIEEEGKIVAVHLSPTKRFVPPFVIYLPDDDKELILDTLAEYLDYTPNEVSLIDRVMSRFRF